MKYLNLLLILIIFACYTGMGSQVLNIWGSEKTEIYHCHVNVDSAGNKANGNPAIKIVLSNSYNANELCCIKSSIKSSYTPDDRKVSFYKISIDDNSSDDSLLVVSAVSRKNTGDYKPPELFLYNSSFLL